MRLDASDVDPIAQRQNPEMTAHVKRGPLSPPTPDG